MGILPLGSTVLMYCSSTNISADVTWNTIYNGHFSDARYSISQYLNEDSLLISLLKIENLILSDSGVYFCLSSQITLSSKF